MRRTLLVVLLSLVACRRVVAQGLELPPPKGLGAAGTAYKFLASRYRRVLGVKLLYKNGLKAGSGSAATACTSGTGWLCAANAAAPSDAQEQQRVLRMAASPDAFDARTNISSAFSPIAAPGDQGTCNSCVGFAVAAAAAAAVATSLEVDGRKVTLSVQDLQFCGPKEDGRVELQRSCQQSWTLLGALNRLVSQPPVDAGCLPYTAPNIKTNRLCNHCSDGRQNAYASQGEFTFEAVPDWADVQQAIREHGGVVTAMTVNIQHLKDFFNANRTGIYKGSPPGTPTQGHAVFVIGYSNSIDGEFWVVQNSAGTDFGDGGFMRVAYGTSGIMPPDNTFKVMFVPARAPPNKLCVRPDPKRKNCYRYTGRSKDYISRVAEAAGVDLTQFIHDNIDQITDLDQPLTGLQLLLCDPDPNSINTVPSSCNSKSKPLPPSLPEASPKLVTSDRCVKGPWKYYWSSSEINGPYRQCTDYRGDGLFWCMLPAFDACVGNLPFTEGMSWKWTTSKSDPDCMTNWTSVGCDGKVAGPYARTVLSKSGRRWCPLPVFVRGGKPDVHWAWC